MSPTNSRSAVAPSGLRGSRQRKSPQSHPYQVLSYYKFTNYDVIIFIKLAGVLVANKVDLKERRIVDEEEGRKFASSKDLEYFECSAVSC